MASRRRAREYGMQALYQSDLRGISTSDALNYLWSGALEGDEAGDGVRPPVSEEVEFAQRLVEGVDQHHADLDARIETCSTNWRVARMPIVDRNILRIAVYELVHCDDIPLNVSINEAVELAKRFGAAESRAFVNGILDRICRTIREEAAVEQD
jgi:transcription antitermination protein NusB